KCVSPFAPLWRETTSSRICGKPSPSFRKVLLNLRYLSFISIVINMNYRPVCIAGGLIDRIPSLIFACISLGFGDLNPQKFEMIKWLLQSDHRNRPSTSEILQSEYLPPKLVNCIER